MRKPHPYAAGLGWDAVSPAIGPLPAIYVHVPAPTGGTMSGIPADLVAPVAGTVRARNDDLAGSPELVNTDPAGGLDG